MRQGGRESLHSRYNPEGEAARYAAALDLNDGIRYYILVEPGLGYLVPALRAKTPRARIVSLHVSDESGGGYSGDASWDPRAEISVQRFLENEIPDIEAAAVRIVEWRPALAVYGEAYLRLLSRAVEFVKRADANARTVKNFGRRWFKNFFRNLFLVSECVNPAPFDSPILVAGAGPGLEEVIPLLQNEKDGTKKSGLVVLAVSSAVSALMARGVEPDLVIASDGGGWAPLHLLEYYRGASSGKKLFLAASMSAALPSRAAENPLLVLSDGSLWQNLVLGKLGIPFLSLPQRGTVSASALDLAFCLSSGNVFLSGVDLAHRDLKTHARPYSFDRLWEEKANRFNPYYSQIFSRAAAIAKGGSHGIYASWFKEQIEKYPRRLYSLGTNNSVFNNAAASLDVFNSDVFDSEKNRQKIIFKTSAVNPGENPARAGAELIAAALKDPALSKKIVNELAMLCPGKESAGPEEITAEVFSLTEKYRRPRRG